MQFTIEEVMAAIQQSSPAAQIEVERNLYRNKMLSMEAEAGPAIDPMMTADE